MAKHASTSEPVKLPAAEEMEELWTRHSEAWRDNSQILSHWQDAASIDPILLESQVVGDFWNVLKRLDITLLVGREYEHLLLGMSHAEAPHLTYMPMPHPSGIAVDRERGIVHAASTRNPNQIFDLMPISGCTERLDVNASVPAEKPLVPVRSRFMPGCLYMHDLAMIGGQLHANSVGQNAIIRINEDSSFQRVWWPKCIETESGPRFGQNHIQLNSIAAGENLETSFFSASSTELSDLRPGDPKYPVDGRGVIFSGATREPIVTGLTRPHSARVEQTTGKSRVWVDNSGYGELCLIDAEKYQVVTRLPGWTRGLAFCGEVAFVGTSRVIPKFAQYAPGLDVNASICAVHAVDVRSGEVLGSIVWPYGNQIFAIDWLPRTQSAGFPFAVEDRTRDLKTMFYTFSTNVQKD
ncbi:MAG TPA: DUF4915 domain-containing protein [Drouetiella sp.]